MLAVGIGMLAIGVATGKTVWLAVAGAELLAWAALIALIPRVGLRTTGGEHTLSFSEEGVTASNARRIAALSLEPLAAVAAHRRPLPAARGRQRLHVHSEPRARLARDRERVPRASLAAARKALNALTRSATLDGCIRTRRGRSSPTRAIRCSRRCGRSGSTASSPSSSSRRSCGAPTTALALTLGTFAAGSLFDLDHIVAAGSLNLHAIETLSGGRPDTHSLVVVVLLTAIAYALTRRPLFAWARVRDLPLAPALRRGRRHTSASCTRSAASTACRGSRARSARSRCSPPASRSPRAARRVPAALEPA